ncbi:YibE/F family protein [Aeromicrobium sp. A1-2]|uniref:YibE/F family protein n=1 Tax=Aeromicrobium sp. A1-2 TaxID=2107713 RepID=UPI0013C2E6F4|nr:YibE/F family protein [Aeromicrobium sp. A1-2]
MKVVSSIIVALVIVLTTIGVIALWPDSNAVPKDQNPYSGPGVSIIKATVTKSQPLECGSGGEGPDGITEVAGKCADVTATTSSGTARFTLDAARAKAGIEVGDKITVVKFAQQGQPTAYEFYDFQRGLPLTLLAIAFAILVVAVARWRGLFAMVGIAVTLLALTKFMLPAFLAGGNPLLVAVVGSTGIMLVVLYLAHGISIRTTSALFGTLAGLAITAVLGLGASGWSHLTGIGSEDDTLLAAVAPLANISGVVAAAMVVAGLGVLNDVTVTQASAVWELRAAKPDAGALEIFASAMRIGRDHIASSVYTLVFAYAGSAMTVLLLIVAYQRGLAEMATTEQIAQEVVRTLVGAIGLVLAVPITTAFAVMMAPPPPDIQFQPPLAGPQPGRRRATAN